MNKAIIIAASLLLAITSCSKKSADNPVAKKVDFTFRNNNPAQLHLDIYSSFGDYNTNHSPIASTDIGINASYTSTGLLVSGATYYMDWYSPDYSYNNWYNGGNIPTLFVPFTPTDSNKSVVLNHPNEVDFSRLVLLNGNGTTSSWHAITATKNGVPVWDTMSPRGRVQQFIFNKTFTGTYSALDSNGNLLTIPTSFIPISRGTIIPDLSCTVTKDTAFASTIHSLTHGASAGHAGKDTITATLKNNFSKYGTFGIVYTLVRD